MKLGTLLCSVFALGLAGCQMDYKVHTDPGPNAEGVDSANPDETEPDETEPDEDTSDTWQPAKDENAPIADCQVSPNPVEPPFEKAAWDGSGSYDPAGGTIVDYNWELIAQPTGSAVVMPNGQAVRNNFTPDLAGDYIGRLTVTNNSGETDSCEVTLESIPAENLWIEMYWEQVDDMDLHLLNSNGTIEDWFWNSDCYYVNCTGSGVEWGNAGPSDNPTLDLDDINGTGPENINIQTPSDSSYTIVVHDFQNSAPSDFMGSNNVTVNVYINGSLEWSDTRGISGDNTYTEFARINWNSGTVTGL